MREWPETKIMTTGASGMLGSYVDFGLRPTSDEVNILDKKSVLDYVETHTPSIILHLAGATDVGRTENDPLYAYELNVRGTYNVAFAANKVGALMVYSSTSRVFKGDKTTLYSEDDKPEPDSYYAQTKYFGEILTASLVPRHIIARTSWVFGGGPEKDNKFYGKILKKLDQPEVFALNDVHGSPTYGKDYIETIKRLIAEGYTGVVHITNAGVATRYDLACYMVEQLKPEVKVKAVDRSFFNASTTLPANEAMMSRHCSLRPWQEALTEYLTTEWGKETV